MVDIVLKNVTKSFGNLSVLQNFSHRFKSKAVTVIMGASGCGKTTLFNMILRLLPPDSGDISGTENEKMVAVFQENRLCDTLNAQENIALVCKNEKEVLKGVDILKSFLLKDEDIKKSVCELSGGMKRRVAIARAICADSSIILMDEPFKGLDESTKNVVLQRVKKQIEGKTVIIITHDEKEAVALGGEILRL